MAKELPYFQFEPAEYLTKDISFCSLSAQGLFINLCSYYWQRECKLTKEQFLRRLNNLKEFNELVEEKVIKLDNDVIVISFLDDQYSKATIKSKTNSVNGSKGGRPKKDKPKLNPIETEIKPKLNPNESESKGIREEKIKEEKKKEDILTEFSNSLKPFLVEYGKEMLNDFYLYWTEKGPKQRKYRFEKEKSFDLSRRLKRWEGNNFNKTSSPGPISKEDIKKHQKITL